MSRLSEKQKKELIKKAKKYIEEMNSIPEDERIFVPDSKKYNFPIGMDDNGKLFSSHKKEPKKN